MTDFYPHQITASNELLAVIMRHGLAYLQGQPRTGKTRTAFRVANLLPVKRVLFLTKKQAIPGIQAEAHVCQKPLTITNYEQAHKLNPEDFDFVIVDEAHNLGTVGKPTARFKTIRNLCWRTPTLLLSGTPFAETPLSAYYQFGISGYTPLRYKTFYEFFRAWGVPSPMFLNGRTIESYKRHRPGLLALLEPYTVRLTQADAGIDAEALDIVHQFILQPRTLSLLEQLATDGVADINGQEVALDSDMAVRLAMHQIEAGALLVNEQIVMVGNTEMADYIRRQFGDSSDVAVMCHYRSTREVLRQHLPNVHLYSSDGHAEGVNLSHYKHFVIANTGFSGAKHIQRRDRGTLIGLTESRKVHHLMAKDQLSEKVYAAVSRKLDFTLQHFRRQCLSNASKPKSLTT